MKKKKKNAFCLRFETRKKEKKKVDERSLKKMKMKKEKKKNIIGNLFKHIILSLNNRRVTGIYLLHVCRLSGNLTDKAILYSLL